MAVMEPSAPYLTRDGYKRTEVGTIPEDWEVKPLHLLAEKITVGIANAATHAYRDRGVVMFRNQNIKPNHLDDRDVLYIDELFEQRYSNKRLKAGDLLTARTGYPGTTSIVPAGHDGAQTFTTLITRPRKSIIDPTYLCFFINSDAGKKYIEQSQAGGGQKNVNAGSLKFLNVALPPTKAEQEAIAEVLSDADALVDSLEQLLAKKRQVKQGAMQELLTGKKRLAGFSREWTRATLGQMGHCHRGVSYNPAVDLSALDTGSTIRLLRANNVQEATVVIEDVQYVDCGRVSAAQLLRASDILMCMSSGSRNLVGKAGRFSVDDGFAYTFGAFMGCFRADRDAADQSFVFYLFQTAQYRAHIAVLLAGSSINNLTPGSVEAFVISVPSDKAEQGAIATILSDMDAEIAAVEARIAKAREIQQGMMQELLTGRIRLV